MVEVRAWGSVFRIPFREPILEICSLEDISCLRMTCSKLDQKTSLGTTGHGWIEKGCSTTGGKNWTNEYCKNSV